MEKRGTFRQHLQRSNKNLRFCISPKINSKLYRNTVTYIINLEILRATKKSLTSTPKTLDCETTVNSEKLASPPSTATVSTPSALTKKPNNFSLLIRHTLPHFQIL